MCGTFPTYFRLFCYTKYISQNWIEGCRLLWHEWSHRTFYLTRMVQCILLAIPCWRGLIRPKQLSMAANLVAVHFFIFFCYKRPSVATTDSSVRILWLQLTTSIIVLYNKQIVVKTFFTWCWAVFCLRKTWNFRHQNSQYMNLFNKLP